MKTRIYEFNPQLPIHLFPHSQLQQLANAETGSHGQRQTIS